MSEIQICPWCQMEIVWDDEFGPEEECPHCLNELKDYRTLTIDLQEEDEDREDVDDDDYEDAVDRIQAVQSEEVPDCEQCQERMIAAGQQTVDKGHFIPNTHTQQTQQSSLPLLQAPYHMHVYVCPSCFQVKTVLSEEDRQAFVHALTQMGNVK